MTAAAVQVQVAGRIHLMLEGQTLPEGVPADTVDALLAKGLVEAVEAEYPDGQPSESWSSKQLDAYAAAAGIELGSGKSKAEKLAAIAAS